MSGDSFADLTDPNLELKVDACFELLDDDIVNNNVNPTIKPLETTAELSPELITDETPPEEVLQLTSDPDLNSDNYDNDDVGEGERTQVDIISPVISSAQIEPLQIHQTPSHTECDGKTMAADDCFDDPVPELADSDNCATTTPNGITTSQLILQPQTTTEEEQLLVDNNSSSSNIIPLTLSDPYFATINTSSGEIDGNDRAAVVEEWSSSVEEQEEALAVDAPEPEAELNASANNDSSQAHNIIPEILSETEDETGAIANDDDNKNILQTNDSSHNSQSLSSPSPSSPPPPPVVGYKLGRNFRRRKGNSTSKTRNSSKSPSRLVEVHQRKSGVQMKSEDGKPLSPYLCKIFPVRERSREGKKSREKSSEKFVVDGRQNRLLDGELNRAVEEEKLKLMELLCDYFNRQSGGGRGTSSGYGGNDIVADGSARETYMSWIIKDKNRAEAERHVKAGMYWNPTSNVFRKEIFTQVSGSPSFSDKEQVTSLENLMEQGTSSTSSSSQSKRIRLVDNEQDDIPVAARKMYESLKTLQRAIHLSDYFCFRNAPELALGSTFHQPGFREFFDSSNEMEMLQRVIGLLSNCKESIQNYFNSVQGATPTAAESSSLSKFKEEINENVAGENEAEEKKEQENNQKTSSSSTSSFQPDDGLSPRRYGILRNRLLPQVHTFVEEQTKVSLSSYYKDPRTLIQSVMCDGHRYQIHFSSADAAGPIQGILRAKMEYVGQPSRLNLETLLNIIHRCANYIDTRIACSAVWARQSKRFLLGFIETYLERRYRPSTDFSWWSLQRMGTKLQKINVFSGIIRQFSGELAEAITKLHFCMQKSLTLLDKLKEPQLPGFPVDFSDFEEVNLNSDAESDSPRTNKYSGGVGSARGAGYTTCVEEMYEKLNTTRSGGGEREPSVSVEVLMKILVLAMRSIESVARQGEQFVGNVKMSKSCRRILRFMNSSCLQLGLSKDVQLGSLIAAFLSAIDKISVFEEFICEQGVEIRAKIHYLCIKIIRNLHDLRGIFCVQQEWSANLSKNTFMRIKEINEIRRLRKLKKGYRFINEKMEFLRGSDRSLRESVW